MVECEFQMSENLHKRKIRFNRYMVECEFFVDTVDWGWFVF